MTTKGAVMEASSYIVSQALLVVMLGACAAAVAVMFVAAVSGIIKDRCQ